MISLVLCNSQKNELQAMEKVSHLLAGRLSDEEWKISAFSDLTRLQEYLRKHPLFDIICLDVTITGSIQLAELLRKENRHAQLILVASTSISPMRYMKPSIMAGSLLIRVYSSKQLLEVFQEAFEAFLVEFQSPEGKEDVYLIDDRDGRQMIPYSQIYFFEARAKKIIVGSVNTEVACYDTIAHLEENLPDNFIRCHRSFIINKDKIETILFSENVVQLLQGISIPISRSYKAALREQVNLYGKIAMNSEDISSET